MVALAFLGVLLRRLWTRSNKIRHELGEVERFDYERNSGQVRSIHDISTSSETNYHDNGDREESKRNIEIENSLDKGNIRKTTIIKIYYKNNHETLKTEDVERKAYNNEFIERCLRTRQKNKTRWKT